MSDMTPDELAWAFQNAGRPPEARKTSSQEFAARARAHEEAVLKEQQRQLARDREWNESVHRQDMDAAAAHHGALMQQYTLIGQARGELGAFKATDEWKQGLFVGIVGGFLLAQVVRAWFR